MLKISEYLNRPIYYLQGKTRTGVPKRNVLVLGPHPDDVEIFAGGTVSQLARLGHRVTAVIATDGSLGLPIEKGLAGMVHKMSKKLHQTLGIEYTDNSVRNKRRREAKRAARILGVKHVHFLGYEDSGYKTDGFSNNSFTECDTREAARKLTDIMLNRQIDVAFYDDDRGIYGHADHVKSHQIGEEACRLYSIGEAYEITFDREQEHFQSTKVRKDKKLKHVVLEAFRGMGFSDEQLDAIEKGQGEEFQKLGRSSVEITHCVPVNGSHIRRKHRSMLAHGSQMPKEITELSRKIYDVLYSEESFTRVSEFGDPQDRSNEILHDISR